MRGFLVSNLYPVKAQRTYGSGRRCAEPGCHTILSMYNPASFCAVHGGSVVKTSPERSRTNKRPPVTHEVECPCGVRFEARQAHAVYCSDACRSNAYAERKRQAKQEAVSV